MGRCDKTLASRVATDAACLHDCAQLRVVTSGGFADAMQMRAAGMAEGYISAGGCWCPFATHHAAGVHASRMSLRLSIQLANNTCRHDC